MRELGLPLPTSGEREKQVSPSLREPEVREAKLCERCEMLRDGPIHIASERHDEIGNTIEPLPSPLIELRRLVIARGQRIDLLRRNR